MSSTRRSNTVFASGCGVVRGELRQETGYGVIYEEPFANPIFNPDLPRRRTIYGETQETYGAIAGGARVRLIKGDHYVVSAQGLVSSGGMDDSGSTVQSDGPFAEARALFGIGGKLAGIHAFFDAQAAYRYRLEADDSDEMVARSHRGSASVAALHAACPNLQHVRDGRRKPLHQGRGERRLYRTATDRIKVEVGAVGTLHGKNAVQEIGGRFGVWWSH